MASRHSQRIKTGKTSEVSGKKKTGGSEDQPLDIMDEDAPLSQIQSKIKKRKTTEVQSHVSEAAAEVATEAAEKGQGLDTPDPKKKKKKKKTKVVTDIVAIEQPVEETPINTQERTPEKSQSSSKLPLQKLLVRILYHTLGSMISLHMASGWMVLLPSQLVSAVLLVPL